MGNLRASISDGNGVPLFLSDQDGHRLYYPCVLVEQFTISGTCVLVKASKVIWGSWTLVVVFEFIVCILLAREALSAYRLGGMSQLAWVVYRDGLMYYVYLMATFVGVVASVIVLPFDMVRFLSGPAHVLHVLLTARVILHAREQANKSTIHEISSSFFTQSC